MAALKWSIMARMMNLLGRSFAVLGFAFLVGGCVTQERVVERRPPPPCAGAAWVPGHTGRSGNWHPGHWRCPGVVEVMVVD
jgi:hypothetical protein